jgi:hypothetical protein
VNTDPAETFEFFCGIAALVIAFGIGLALGVLVA